MILFTTLALTIFGIISLGATVIVALLANREYMANAFLFLIAMLLSAFVIAFGITVATITTGA